MRGMDGVGEGNWEGTAFGITISGEEDIAMREWDCMSGTDAIDEEQEPAAFGLHDTQRAY